MYSYKYTESFPNVEYSDIITILFRVSLMFKDSWVLVSLGCFGYQDKGFRSRMCDFEYALMQR